MTFLNQENIIIQNNLFKNMKLLKWVIFLISFLFVAWATFELTIWGQDFKDSFLLSDKIMDYVVLTILIMSIGAIFRYFLILEAKTFKRK